MFKLADLTPTNLQEEKEKFFASNFKYNPQFKYRKHIPQSYLLEFGKPKLKYLFLAKKIQRIAKKNKINSKNNPINQELLVKKIKSYLKDYQLENDYQIDFSKDFVSRISVNFKEKSIKVRLPIVLQVEDLEGILNHELGTHALRQLNYEQQKWYKKKKRYGLHNHTVTEEGLAVINEKVAAKNLLLDRSAFNYLGVYYAMRHSFVQTFQFFLKKGETRERAWNVTFKKKRGLKNTSLHLAFTKDLVYFQGAIEVLKYLRKNNYDPTALYWGKLDWRDVEKVKKMNPNFEPLLPRFYTDNPKKYQEKIKAIIKANF